MLESLLSDDVRHCYPPSRETTSSGVLPMGIRISARLDAATSEKLTSLQQITGANVTGVLTAALERYYNEQVLRANDGNLGLLALAGLFDGPADLSANYKDELTRALDRKTAGHR